MQSSASIVFNSHPSTPIFYQSATNTYHLCPSCFRQRETRFCSGKSILSWELCEKHEERTSSGKKTTLYEPDDLTFFRDALLDGKLTDHFRFKVGNPGDNGIQEDLTFRSPSYFKPASNPTIKTNGVDQDGFSPEGNTRGADKDLAASGARAVLMLNRGSSDASSDHTTLGSSTTITSDVRKALSEEVSGSDRTSRNQRRCQSSATSHTVKPPYHAPIPPTQVPQMKRAIHSPTKSQIPANTAPKILVRYAHDTEAGCIYSASPTMQVIDRHVIRALNRQKLRHLEYLREQYDAGWGSEPDLKQKHALILEEVQASNFEKALYFKRCNGEYVNGIGEAVNRDVILNMTEEALKRIIDESYRRQDEYFSAKMENWARQMLLVDKEGLGTQDGKDSGYASPASDKDNAHSTPSSKTLQAQEHDPLVHLAAARDKQDCAIGNGEPRAGALRCKSEVVKTANLNPDEIFSPDDLSDTSEAPKDAAASSTPLSDSTNNVFPHSIPAPEIEGTTLLQDLEQYLEAIKPKTPLATLLAREELVRLGQMSEEDLIVTCWAMNSQKESK